MPDNIDQVCRNNTDVPNLFDNYFTNEGWLSEYPEALANAVTNSEFKGYDGY